MTGDPLLSNPPPADGSDLLINSPSTIGPRLDDRTYGGIDAGRAVGARSGEIGTPIAERPYLTEQSPRPTTAESATGITLYFAF